MTGVQTCALPISPIDLASSSVSSEPRFDISVVDHPAKDFFNSLVIESGRNVVVHPDVTGSVTLSLKDVTVEDVLYVTKELYGYEFDETDRFIMVFPSGLRTRIFQTDYLDISRSGGSDTHVSSGQITQSSAASGDASAATGEASSSRPGTQIKTRSENTFWQNLESTMNLIIGDQDGRSVVVTPSAGIVVVRADSQEL